jgi:hypothetical protein
MVMVRISRRFLEHHHAYPDLSFLLFDCVFVISCSAVARCVLGVACGRGLWSGRAPHRSPDYFAVE